MGLGKRSESSDPADLRAGATAQEQDGPISAAPGRRAFGVVSVIVVALIMMTIAGVGYRHWGWHFTEVARFRGDIHRNFTFGEKALADGYLNVHENQLRDNPPRNDKLDYPPLRLLTFEAWAAWMHAWHPDESWNEGYAFHAPLMRYYTFLEWMAALAALLIVWHWRQVCAGAELPLGERPGPWLGVGRGLVAFALLWFDPGVLIIGHGWPSPNVWSLPFYLWPVLLCLWDLWFVSGLVLAIGTMMQGQLLSVVAVFILWPIFAWKLDRLYRWVSGFALGFMLVASPWMVSSRPDIQLPLRVVNWTAVLWIVGSVALLALVAMRYRLGKRWHWGWFVAPAIAGVVVLSGPTFKTLGAMRGTEVAVLATGIVALCWWGKAPVKRYLFPLVVAGCLLACVPLFGASTGWWEVGFLYGAERFPHVASNLTANLSTLLEQYLGWKEIHDHALSIGQGVIWGWPSAPLDVSVRQFLGVLFGIMLVLSGFFIARQWRRRNLNLLVALVLPWVLFFTVMPQMSPRYTVFAAGVGAICIGHSVGMTLVTWIFSALTVIQTGQCMMGPARRFMARNPNWFFNMENYRTFNILIPSLAWVEVFACLIFVYVAFDLSRKRRRLPLLKP